MALPSDFLEELRARTPLPGLIGRRVRLTRAGRQWRGCCPFHGERTPSFYVYEDHFHCFGCGAHGDAISYMMRAQGGSFMDAVSVLAAEAGLEVPALSPQAALVEERRAGVSAALEGALFYFRQELRGEGGRAARDYLAGRGVSAEIAERFGLGWSGPGRGGLVEQLRRGGIAASVAEAAGLLRSADSGERRELFYNRLMFPIRDRRSRLVSFGGRTLGDAQPKYVNGPETETFAKRRTLYGLDLAREPVRAGADLLIVEGYMDVIGLHQAGFQGAVAPLGTALTEEQLEEIWRLSPSPVLAFDGDKAGRRAALRALDLALPKLAPERTIRILLLPDGEDPDSLIRARGPAGFSAQLAGAIGVTEALFELARAQIGSNTPEQRARLREMLEAQAGRVAHKALAFEYKRDLVARFFAARPRNGAPPAVLRRPRSAPSPVQADGERSRILTAILLRHPQLWHDVEDAFHQLEMPSWLGALRDEISRIIDAHAGSDGLDSRALITQLHASGMTDPMARVFAADPLRLPACAREEAMPAEAEQGWWYHYGLLHGRAQLTAEIRTLAVQHLDSDTEARLIALRRAQIALDAEPGSVADTED